jgi:hypothetical protein
MSLRGFSPSRTAGLDRLAQFLPLAGRAYAASRNEDRGAGHHEHVSCLSPWLRHRQVTETEVLRAVLSLHAPSTAQKFIQEVFWRGYFKGYLEARPTIWSDWRRVVNQQLTEIGRVLTDLIGRDKRSRQKRDEQYEEGMRRTGLGDDAPGGAEFMGASKVVHPMLTEACVDFAARAMKEIFPANGPAKAFKNILLWVYSLLRYVCHALYAKEKPDGERQSGEGSLPTVRETVFGQIYHLDMR